MSNKFKFDTYQPIIVLPVVFKGKVTITAQMALDTGATYLMIPWKIIKALGLDPETTKETTPVITASGVLMAPIVILKSVGIGVVKQII
jgi:predicted aspartyl protease